MIDFQEQVKGKLSWSIIVDMIQREIGFEISNIKFNIKKLEEVNLESMNVTYNIVLNSITFEINKSKPYIGLNDAE